ncbi:MAG: biotin synthesis protein BioC [Ramlibacter sp.]|jgi:malonyl-CoA O-methyltransferase|nr:biotin synthesis protein BioC [Ramlibacter sp.]
MATERPPTIDPVAAARWERAAPPHSPWLHEEVGRRMEDRLQWIRLKPACWADWEPVRGGLKAHALVEARYPEAQCFVAAAHPETTREALKAFARPWWRRLGTPAAQVGALPDGQAQMLWANMALHATADPQALIAQWHRALAVDGFLMFSCLGPDSLRELRPLYAALDWPPPAHEFTDMHDWGDMLVEAGFAEPVMDMERITLTWDSPAKLLAELAQLGSNLHPRRFRALRGRRWRKELEAELVSGLGGVDGRLALTFEIIYGHALKPAPRVRMSGESAVSLEDMRSLLQSGKGPRV